MSDIQNKYSEIKSKFNDFLKDSKQNKAVWEVRSYVNESFYEWNHRVVFDKVLKQLVNLPLKSDNQFAIWKIRKIVRWVRNMITKNEPRWHIKNSRNERLTDDERKIASAVLQQKYKEEHIKDKIKDLITHWLTKTLAWCYIWYDNRKDDIDIFIEDPFNIYTSPDGRLEWPVFVWKYIIRTVRKSLDDVKNSELYKNWDFKEDLEKISSENRMAESDYKNINLQENYLIPVDENWTVIVKELYILEDTSWSDKKEDKKEWDNDTKNENKELENNISVEEDQLYLKNSKTKVRIITMVWDFIIRDELTNYGQFPFLCYQPERDKWLLYNPSWIEPLIDLNRSLNEWYSNRADWLEKFAKGRYLVQKGSRFTVIKWKNWQIVEYTWSKPTQMEHWNLPQEVNIHLSDTERFMEDIWWIHSESMWRLSGASLSWVAIAQLQASDNNNVSEPVDNLKSFMEELAYRILDLASKYYKLHTMSIEWEGTYNVVWSNVKKKISSITGTDFKSEVVEIKPLRNIEVEIIPWSAFSDLQARQDLVELKWLWLPIPDALIIESYKLWNTEQIINSYEEEQQQKMVDESWTEWLEASQAELENKKMLQGIQIAVQQSENHKIHLAIHWAILESIKDKQEIVWLFMNHMQQHEAMLSQWDKIQQEKIQNNWQNQMIQ